MMDEFDWTAERTKSTWIFREVEFPSMKELGNYDIIKGGSGELSALSDMKMTGTLEVDGGTLNELNLLRVLYYCENALGQKTKEIPVATYFIQMPEPVSRATNQGQRISGQVNCTSTLSVLKDKLLHEPLVLPKGTPAVFLCMDMIAECSLPYERRSDTSYVTGRDREYQEGTPYLEVINDLLDLAGFRALYPDEYGTLILEKYVSPFSADSVFTFERGENAIHMRDIAFSSNYRETPTTIIGSYSADTYKIISVADNIDQNSPSSLPNRGNRRKEEWHQIEELTATTKEEQIAEVERETVSTLKANSSSIQHKEIKNLFVPVVRPNKVITLIDQGINFTGAVTNVSINYGANALCTTKARSIVKYDLQIYKDTKFYGDFHA